LSLKNEEKEDWIDVIKLIRSIQKKEKEVPCFMTEKRFGCKKMDCKWRKYCLKGIKK